VRYWVHNATPIRIRNGTAAAATRPSSCERIPRCLGTTTTPVDHVQIELKPFWPDISRSVDSGTVICAIPTFATSQNRCGGVSFCFSSLTANFRDAGADQHSIEFRGVGPGVLERAEACTGLLEGFEHVEEIAFRARQPVQARDHQHVSAP
jgi:hypothetical protein